jgi:hypothetical protein
MLMGYAPMKKSTGADKSSSKSSIAVPGKKVPALAPRPTSRPSSQEYDNVDAAKKKKKKKKFASKMAPAELSLAFARKRKSSGHGHVEVHSHGKSESHGERKIAPAPPSQVSAQAQLAISNSSLPAPASAPKAKTRPHLSNISGRRSASHESDDEPKRHQGTAMTHTTRPASQPSSPSRSSSQDLLAASKNPPQAPPVDQAKTKNPKPQKKMKQHQHMSSFITPHEIKGVIPYNEWVKRNKEAAAAESSERKEASGESSSQASPSPPSESSATSPALTSQRTNPRSVTSTGCSICLKNDSLDELLLCDNDCGRGALHATPLRTIATTSNTDFLRHAR